MNIEEFLNKYDCSDNRATSNITKQIVNDVREILSGNGSVDFKINIATQHIFEYMDVYDESIPDFNLLTEMYYNISSIKNNVEKEEPETKEETDDDRTIKIQIPTEEELNNLTKYGINREIIKEHILGILKQELDEKMHIDYLKKEVIINV